MNARLEIASRMYLKWGCTRQEALEEADALIAEEARTRQPAAPPIPEPPISSPRKIGCYTQRPDGKWVIDPELPEPVEVRAFYCFDGHASLLSLDVDHALKELRDHILIRGNEYGHIECQPKDLMPERVHAIGSTDNQWQQFHEAAKPFLEKVKALNTPPVASPAPDDLRAVAEELYAALAMASGACFPSPAISSPYIDWKACVDQCDTALARARALGLGGVQ